MTYYVQLFLSALGLTSCKSFQQINVTERKRWYIPPTSYAFAFFELVLLQGGFGVITSGGSILAASVAMGTGAWIGCFISMWVHDVLGERDGRGAER